MTTPKNKDEPSSLDFSYTPVYSVTETTTFYTKLNYLYNLDDDIKEKYLLVTEGSGVLIDMHERLVNLEKLCGEGLTSAGLTEAEKRDFYEKYGNLPISKYETKTIKITTGIQQSRLIDEYMYYVYTNDPELIQADEQLSNFVRVSEYIVQTMPPALDVYVTGENREKFVNYMKEHYPSAEVTSGRQLSVLDERETHRLRREQIAEYKRIWQKIQDSADNVPEEISSEDFRELDDNSEYKTKFYKYNGKIFAMLNEDHGFRMI